MAPLSCAIAGEAEKEGEQERVDTEFIFGFTAGADVGELGERELEHQTQTQWAKRGGSYTALTDQLRYETSPVQDFRFEIGAPIACYNMSGVTGLDDRNQAFFNGVSTEFRYRLFDRDHAPFGLTLGAEPHWARTDEITGERVENYGGELSVALDKELVKDRIFAAFNAVYDREISRAQGAWVRESMLAFSVAMTTQISSGVFVGAKRATCANMTASTSMSFPARPSLSASRPTGRFRRGSRSRAPGASRSPAAQRMCLLRSISSNSPASRRCFASNTTSER